jgi:hypothetical protein
MPAYLSDDPHITNRPQTTLAGISALSRIRCCSKTPPDRQSLRKGRRDLCCPRYFALEWTDGCRGHPCRPARSGLNSARCHTKPMSRDVTSKHRILVRRLLRNRLDLRPSAPPTSRSPTERYRPPPRRPDYPLAHANGCAGSHGRRPRKRA